MSTKSLLYCLFAYVICGYMLVGCIDDSLQQVPIVLIERPYREQPFQFSDSTEINQGLLFRKLKERGYEDLWGLARFDFSKLSAAEAFDFDPLLLRCEYQGQILQILVSVHRTFQSVLDVFAIVPSEYEILQIYPSEDGARIIVDLIQTSDFAMDRQQIFKLSINREGKIAQE